MPADCNVECDRTRLFVLADAASRPPAIGDDPSAEISDNSEKSEKSHIAAVEILDFGAGTRCVF